jgi:hypothetical protein
VSLIVDCYSGHRGEETPLRIQLGSTRIAVVEVVDRWLAPEHRFFKLRGDDGRLYLVRHDEASQRWELVRVMEWRAST